MIPNNWDVFISGFKNIIKKYDKDNILVKIKQINIIVLTHFYNMLKKTIKFNIFIIYVKKIFKAKNYVNKNLK